MNWDRVIMACFVSAFGVAVIFWFWRFRVETKGCDDISNINNSEKEAGCEK